ncbi:histidinol-phosphate aminotransferase [Neocallimastix lanati (nom. inval.)]|jgi:histidinol-phosphate aminotransferase|uniref:histidinol-phosphate transaminase n=1 Tax=Neocallimastix californiae TaxID=1754190 RepID=A0A1Y2DB38_9FUNG|nr:histidinol-phosphate aminotransferase [Neocallimastix sp. JGI-2020a]ORY56481.1 histidinol-phosphate aminotransferase [Neocallimastix californiae]|eukprot:ORY56481.1 histidinol-phosphate aminotransferase [Neocallimastix californiae]
MAPSNFNLKDVVRPNIWALDPYRCARDDYWEGILIDANENSFGTCVNFNDSEISLPKPSANDMDSDTHIERYPDPRQLEFKTLFAKLRGLSSPKGMFVGVGSDESIDIIMRVFGVPGKDKILITPPTYGMYSVCAQTNDLGVVKVPLLLPNFQLDVEKVKETLKNDPTIKMVILCSPGNPTGSVIALNDIRAILEFEDFKGIVVVDEAYIDFVEETENKGSVAKWVEKYPNLIVTQTLSKSFGLAGIRCGIAITTEEIAAIINKTKAPYNVSTPASLIARKALSDESVAKMKENAKKIIAERTKLIEIFKSLDGVGDILGTNDGNFILVQVVNKNGVPSSNRAHKIYKGMANNEKVVVRYRGNEYGCEGGLRITVGNVEENKILIEKFKKLLSETIDEE